MLTATEGRGLAIRSRLAILTVLTVLCGFLAIAAAPPSPAAAVPTGGMSATDLNAAFTTYGNAGNHWTGADGTTSIALPDGRVVWFFSDTFLGTVNADFSRPAFTPMVNNSAVVQDGTALTATLRGGTDTEPRALVAPATGNGEFYWVADGTVEDGKLKVFYNRMRRSGMGTLDFELVGTALATFALPSLQLTSVVDLPVGDTINWGSSLLTDGDYTYIYGTSSAPGRMKFAHLARAAAGDVGGSWQFWTGTAWSADSAASARILSGVGTAYSVLRIGTQYVLATHENNLLFDPQIVAYTASSPTGPFAAPRHLYMAPEVKAGSDTIVYDVRLHPELARTGKLLLSYNVNSLKFADQMADVRLYRPRFIEVDWPLPALPTTPAAPAGLTVTAQDDHADLNWTAAPGATGYRVYQKDVTGGQTHFARQPAVLTVPSFRAGLLIPGHRYEFKVATVDGTGEGPASAAVDATPHSTRPVAEAIRYAGTPQAIAGTYIVSLRPGAVPAKNITAFAKLLLAQSGGTLSRTFPETLHGFSATMTEAQANDLASHPDVVDVEQNSFATLEAVPAPVTKRAAGGGLQTDAPWHLDRIDQRDSQLNGEYHYPGDGSGVTAWVVDTGVQPDHPEFAGRMVPGKNVVMANEDTSDCNGHGTQVAGALGGTVGGVAKGVLIAPIRVGRCGEDIETHDLFGGIEWVATHAKKPAVMNLSIGMPAKSKDADDITKAVTRVLSKDITVVTSAGNGKTDACRRTPNAINDVIVVGGTAKPILGEDGEYLRDTRWPNSNFGECVDLWAPADKMELAQNDGGVDVRAAGTSLAAPMVAGAAAILLAAHPGYGPAAVQQALVEASDKGKIDNTNSPNDGMLYLEQPPPAAPTGLTAAPNDNGTIALSWQPVSEPNVHYVISSRDVTAGDTDFVDWDKPVFGATSAVSEELLAGHRYEFVVAAANTAGTGPRSNIAAATAGFAAPPKPTGLTATPGTDGTIKLSWNSLGPDVWYWVYQRDLTAGETEYTKLELPVTEGTTMTAGYLTHGHQYEFRVSGTTRGGEGPQSDPASGTSNYPEPPPPANLTATPGDGQVVLKWSAATPDAWYNVYQRDVTAGETDFTRLPLPVAGCCTMNAGFLTNGHVYEFKVTASVQTRESAATAAVRATPQVARPGQVTGLTATAKTDGTIGLAWTSPGENLWFDVYQRDVTAGESFRKLEYPVTSCCTFTAALLTHEHAYEFKIAATNAAGAGPQSAAAGATARYSPPAAPKNLRGEAIGNATINLNWDPPGPGNFFYWVYFRDVTAGQTSFTKGQFPTDRSEASLGLLVNNHVYEYKVSASNPGGEGPASTPVRVTAKGGLPAAPSGLSATAGDGQVSLRWTASSTSGVQYNVYQRDVTAGQSWQKLALPTTSTSMTAGLLSNGHTYEFKVSASNSAGSSGFSNVASAKPMPPLPAAPSGLSASAGNGQVALSWTKSSTSNVDYWIEMRPAGGTWDRLPYPVSTCCSFTVKLLTNGKTYEFRVRAHNMTGDSGVSNVASARPMPPFPQPASGLSATAGDARVALRWTASPTSGVNYLIDMRSKGGTWSQLPYPVGCCSFTVGLLNNGTTYEFRIRATNMTGTAAASNTAAAKPMPPIPQPPTDLRATGNAKLTQLTWSPSKTPYVGYKVYMRDVAQGQAWSEAVVFPANNNASLGMLQPGHLYEFRVTAHNMSGESQPSNVASLRMPYIGASVDCNDHYVEIKDKTLPFGYTAVHAESWGAVGATNASIESRIIMYVDGRLLLEHSHTRVTSASGAWQDDDLNWDIQASIFGSSRVDVTAYLAGNQSDVGEARASCTASRY